MKQDPPVLNTQQRTQLQAPVAPAGMWERIEQAALRQQAAGPLGAEEAHPLLGGVSRFQHQLRFVAAGMLGFLMFFGLEQAVTQSVDGGAKTSLVASGLHLVDYLREEVPLVHDPASYVDGMQGRTPWPEVTLATYISTNEAN